MRAASLASLGLPRSWPSTTTTVSAPSTTSCGRWRATASAFSRARRSAQAFAVSPASGSSGISAGSTSKINPALRNNSLRRGEAEASTSMELFSRATVAADSCRAALGLDGRDARPHTRTLLQRFGFDGNVLFALGALFPVFLYPGFVAFPGGGVASGEGYGGDFGIRNGWALVAGR